MFLKKKILVIIFSIIFLSCLGGMFLIKQSVLPPKAHIPTGAKYFPTIGNPYASINITVFEEPSCLACAEFSTEVFPLLKERYVDTGEVSLTLIPVSFIKGSKAAAQALMCVYYHDARKPDVEAYFQYFHNMLLYPKEEGKAWASPEVLSKLVSDVKTHSGRSINAEGLIQCVQSQKYKEQIRKNNIYGSKVLGGELATPSVVVEDYLIEDPTFDEIERVIKQLKLLQDVEENHD